MTGIFIYALGKAIANIEDAQDHFKRDYERNVILPMCICVIITLSCMLSWSRKVCLLIFSILMQVLQPGTKVLLRNSAQDERKGGKLQERWLDPYIITEFIGK